MVGAEAVCQRLEEGDARTGGQLGIAREDLARERDAGGLAAAGQQLLAELDEVAERCSARSRRSRVRSISARPRSAMVCSMSPKKDVFTGTNLVTAR